MGGVAANLTVAISLMPRWKELGAAYGNLAGGLTPFAAENDIKVLRRQNGKDLVFPFRYSDVKKGEKLEQNIILKGGDVVVVP